MWPQQTTVFMAKGEERAAGGCSVFYMAPSSMASQTQTHIGIKVPHCYMASKLLLKPLGAGPLNSPCIPEPDCPDLRGTTSPRDTRTHLHA